jgi:hypothetical protein
VLGRFSEPDELTINGNPPRRGSKTCLGLALPALALILAAGCIPADFAPEPQQAGVDLDSLPGQYSKPHKSEASTPITPPSKEEQLDEDIVAPPDSAGGEKKELSKGQLAKAPELRPKGLRFGMSIDDIVKVYEQVVDQDYLPKWEEVEPGVQMQQLEREIEEKKLELRRDQIDFDGTPTGMEGTALQNEYTHNNKEALLRIPRKDKVRNIFFIQGGAWKVIDVYELGEKSRWGADFNSAVEKLTKILKGPEGIRLPADQSIGRFEEVVWMDGKTLLRLINMEDGKFAIGYVDQKVAENISNLRKSK